MSNRRVIAISVVLLMLAVMVSPLPAVRANGGYRGWASIARMRLHYAGMVKPIDGLRNYDGTLDQQSPGYSVLWTGRYAWCGTPIGEGTGGHPGVDIRVPCGTRVRAVGEGRVIYSYSTWASDNNRQGFECANNYNAGFRNWGNRLVILHSAVPDAAGYGRFEGVTSHYTHLRSVTGAAVFGDAQYGDGNTKVLRGTVIGEVGSTGGSTGPHLHFQIDRDTNTAPYWPPDGVCSSQSVPYVQANTFSPMRFVQAHEVRQIAAIGDYYSGANFETYRGSRSDGAINFEWFSGAPGMPNVGADNFSVRWRGTIHVPTAGWYAFFATADDGIRVWVGGEQDAHRIINRWADGPSYTYQAIRYLTAGDHSVRVDYYERGGDATAMVAWKPVSRILLATSWEPGQPLGNSNLIQYRSNVAGWNGNDSPPPECSPRQGEIRRSGNWAEMIAGQDMSASANSFCYYRVFDDNIEIREGTMIGFWIYHDTASGANATATRRVSVDGVATDGTVMRDFSSEGWMITDQHGVRTHPAHRNGPLNQWYYVEVDLTPMAGKTLDYIMFAYDDNAFSETGRYRSYVDDFYVFWP